MADSAKDKILKRVTEEGHTNSYGALLYFTAFMGSDPEALGPANSVELTSWSGQLDGLRAALRCLAMHERKIAPENAADVVTQHIVDATAVLGLGGDAGSVR